MECQKIEIILMPYWNFLLGLQKLLNPNVAGLDGKLSNFFGLSSVMYDISDVYSYHVRYFSTIEKENWYFRSIEALALQGMCFDTK